MQIVIKGKTPSESAVRRKARRAGYRLMKSKTRTPEDHRFGTFMLVDERTNAVVLSDNIGNGYGLELDEINDWLKI